MMGDPETQREMQEMQRNMANTQNQVKIENIYYGNLWYGVWTWVVFTIQVYRCLYY